MIARLLTRLAAQRLAKHGSHAQRQRIIAKAVEMRRQLGLPDDPRLAA